MKTFFLATNNKHKIKEVLEIAPEIDWKTIADFPELDGFDPEETGKTFTENAEIKARAYAEKTGLTTVAEDSGLEVFSLNREPGIYSARWFPGSDKDRNMALLDRLENKDKEARYVATICVFDPKEDKVNFFEGEVLGEISSKIKGDKGFGYDPLFIPDGYDQTFGELGEEVKQKLSHRKDAFTKFLKWLSS
jgi:XTP/dITP diphosphohydrolase